MNIRIIGYVWAALLAASAVGAALLMVSAWGLR